MSNFSFKKFRYDSPDVKFIIKENERKVICIIDNCAFDFINFITDKEPFVDDTILINKMSNRFIGIATCAEEDVWNLEIGKEIALTKAVHKWGVSFFKKADAYMNAWNQNFEKTFNNINVLGEKLSRFMNGKEEKIQRYFNATNTETK